MDTNTESKGIIGDLTSGLMDFSFTKFITPSIVKILFFLMVALVALVDLGMLGFSFVGGIASGLAALIFIPIIFCFQVIMIRVYMEVIIVLFRIEQNTRK